VFISSPVVFQLLLRDDVLSAAEAPFFPLIPVPLFDQCTLKRGDDLFPAVLGTSCCFPLENRESSWTRYLFYVRINFYVCS